MKGIRHNILLICLGIFLAFLLLEIALRVGGLIYITVSKYNNRVTYKTQNEYRILALGESTTADFHNGQGSWPTELELILNNQSNIRFRVFNEGYPGTTSRDIMLNLQNNLDKYHPNLVITMMGINDKGPYFLHAYTQEKGFFSNFRVYKLIKYFIGVWNQKQEEKIKIAKEESDRKEEARLKKDVEINTEDNNATINLIDFYYSKKMAAEFIDLVKKLPDHNSTTHLFELGEAYLYAKKYNESEEALKEVIVRGNLPKKYLDRAYVDLGDLYRETGRIDEAMKIYNEYLENQKMELEDNETFTYLENGFIKPAQLYLRKKNYSMAYKLFGVVIAQDPNKVEEVYWFSRLAENLNRTGEALLLLNDVIQENPNNYAAYEEIGRYYLNHNNTEEAEELFENKFKLKPLLEAREYDNQGRIYQEMGQVDKADEMFKEALTLRKRYYIQSTENNYAELYNILHERGIKIFIMQYPTLEVNDLKNIFQGDENITFIENKDNFERAFSNSSFNGYFVDDFGWTFGHATRKGNRLIAENVADVIIAKMNIS